jgi:hypothetical protein
LGSSADYLAEAIAAAKKLMAPYPLPEWVPEAIQKIALAANNFRRAHAALPLRAEISGDLHRIDDQIVRLETLLDDFCRRTAHAAYLKDISSDVLGPRRMLRARLAHARIAIEHWKGAMSGRGTRDALQAFGAPDPELICAGGAAALRKIIRDREIPRRNEQSWTLCDALLELSGGGSSGGHGESLADRLARWEQYLVRVRYLKFMQDEPAATARMLANMAIENAGGAPEPHFRFDEKL